MNDSYEYDVAFSFLQQDEQLAAEMADRIRDRVKVFIYSEQQKQLIANDGIDAFSRVFRREARIVVVLYRESWGNTKWTRIEETAIKSRQFDEGFKFRDRCILGWKAPNLVSGHLDLGRSKPLRNRRSGKCYRSAST